MADVMRPFSGVHWSPRPKNPDMLIFEQSNSPNAVLPLIFNRGVQSSQISEQRTQVRFQQTHNQDLRQFVLDCALGPLCLSRHTAYGVLFFSVVPEAVHE